MIKKFIILREIGGIRVAGLDWTSNPPRWTNKLKPPQMFMNVHVNIGESCLVINKDQVGIVECIGEWEFL